MKWACGCTYQCQFCNSKFGTQQHFQTHLEEKHKKLDLELEPFTSTIFACNICAFVGHKDPSIVSKHVGDVHNLSLEEYFANHVEASNKTSNSQFDDKIDFDDTYSSTDTGLGTSIKQESTAIDNSLISNQVEVEEEINCDQTTETGFKAPWYCGTLYECKICWSQFYELPDLKRHLSGSHGQDLDDVTKTRGDPTVESNVHECLVCGRGISHNQTTIRYHIRNHGLTMNLYYEQNKTELEQDSVQLSVTDQTLIEKTSKRKSLNNSAYEVTAHDEINEWLNRCVYTCKLCSGYETNQFGTFVSHLKSSHNVPIKSYREQNNGEVTTKYVQHTCQICSSVFAWDKQMLRRHLSSNHSHISANDYALKYRDSYSDNLLLEEQENETAQWMDGCSFDCKECNECKFNSRKSLLLHLKSAHEMTSTEYFKKYRHFSSA